MIALFEMIKDLEKELNRADSAYYDGFKPVISDMMYDINRKKLDDIVKKYTFTNNFAFFGDKVKQIKPIECIPNVLDTLKYLKNEVITHTDSIIGNNVKVIKEPKVSGLSFQAVYNRNELSLVAVKSTRVGGIGIDISKNLKQCVTIPMRINSLPSRNLNSALVFTGVFYITDTDFNDYFFQTHVSPRHAVTDLILNKYSFKNKGNRYIKTLCYEIFDEHATNDNYLFRNDFSVDDINEFKYIPRQFVFDFFHNNNQYVNETNISSLHEQIHRSINNSSIAGDIPTHGSVFKILIQSPDENRVVLYTLDTFKIDEPLDSYLVTIERICNAYDSNENIYPIAYVTPRRIDDTYITKVSLHSNEYIKHFNLKVGSQINVRLYKGVPVLTCS